MTTPTQPSEVRGMPTEEQVAEAICDARLWKGAWHQANELERSSLLYEARAVLALLPSPSPDAKEIIAGAVAEERERCAELADEYYAAAMTAQAEDKAEAGKDWDHSSYGAGFQSGEACAASEIAQAIRALSTTAQTEKKA